MSHSLIGPKCNIYDLLYNPDSLNNSRQNIAKLLNLKYKSYKHTNGIRYHVAKYDKEWLSDELKDSLGLCRSLIFKDNGTIVCFAPPKSLDVCHVKIENAGENTKEQVTYYAETFVEGTMINVFYEGETDTWEIATKSNIGGDTCFFMEDGYKKENTFKYMFEEACKISGLKLENLNKNYMYSFVLQHPRNRIVKLIKRITLYLVEVYEIVSTSVIIVPIQERIHELGIADTSVKLVERKKIESEEQLEQCKKLLASMNTRYDIVGLVVKNNVGHRYKFRNPNYETVKKLRGNNPKLQYQYLVLRQHGKVRDYLQYYKEHKSQFNDFRNIMHQYTNELFVNYISCYIKKQKELKDFPEKYRTHMYVLHHELYLKDLLPEKKYVTKEIVINYFNSIHPSKQMFVLNYDVRKNYLEDEKHKLLTKENK